MILFLKHYRLLLIPTVLVLACGLAYSFGHHNGAIKTKAHYQQILLKQVQETQAQQQTWLRQAEQINQQQLELQKQNQQQADELKKEIQNIIAKDKQSGADCIGIGTHSLQHYKQSLGY